MEEKSRCVRVRERRLAFKRIYILATSFRYRFVASVYTGGYLAAVVSGPLSSRCFATESALAPSLWC